MSGVVQGGVDGEVFGGAIQIVGLVGGHAQHHVGPRQAYRKVGFSRFLPQPLGGLSEHDEVALCQVEGC